ncbi:hypothetical protein [Haladaptatus sp. DFWS20]|uniref:hypothetical protein n=1 Tax=Haladaptatus sp. DFWS20 TaxID=3403467 RepID=UPI003EBAC7AE
MKCEYRERAVHGVLGLREREVLLKAALGDRFESGEGVKSVVVEPPSAAVVGSTAASAAAPATDWVKARRVSSDPVTSNFE